MAQAHEGALGSASGRAVLRRGLPALYRDEDDALVMRFVTGLEEVLDPVVSLLDSLHAHFDVELAPVDLLALVTAWRGLDPEAAVAADAQLDERDRRSLARSATRLVRSRGTREGLQELLALAFPALEVTVEDTGAAWVSDVPRDAPRAEAPAFTVTTGTSSVSRETEASRRSR